MDRNTAPGNSRGLAATALREAGDLRLACGVLREPFAWWVMLLSLAGAVVVLAALGVLVWWLLAGGGWHPDWLERHAWLRWLCGGFGTVLYGVAAWFLFPVIVTAVAGVFLESLADRIERRHYPEIPPPRNVSLGEQIRTSARGLLRGLGWNLLALPLYLVPGVNLAAYVYINARLLSREYFQVVALRHLPANTTRELYRVHHWQMVRGGLGLMGLFVLPVVQLIAPLLATGWAVHRLWRRPDAILRVAVTGAARPDPAIPSSPADRR